MLFKETIVVYLFVVVRQGRAEGHGLVRVINTLNTKFSWQSLGGEGMSTVVGNDVDKNL